MAEEPVGTVTHYFAKPRVGVVSLTGEVRGRRCGLTVMGLTSSRR